MENPNVFREGEENGNESSFASTKRKAKRKGPTLAGRFWGQSSSVKFMTMRHMDDTTSWRCSSSASDPAPLLRWPTIPISCPFLNVRLNCGETSLPVVLAARHRRQVDAREARLGQVEGAQHLELAAAGVPVLERAADVVAALVGIGVDQRDRVDVDTRQRPRLRVRPAHRRRTHVEHHLDVFHGPFRHRSPSQRFRRPRRNSPGTPKAFPPPPPPAPPPPLAPPPAPPSPFSCAPLPLKTSTVKQKKI